MGMTTEEEMSAVDFRDWLDARLLGRVDSVADQTTKAEEIVNGELRPSLVAFFPGGAFVITIGKVAK